MEMLNIEESPWHDNHHHSSFLPSLDEIKKGIPYIFPTDIVNTPQSQILIEDTISKGNLGNISQTISVDILEKEGFMENMQLGANCSTTEIENYTLFKEFRNIFSWSYEEIPGIDPLIMCMKSKITLELNLYEKNYAMFILRNLRK
jgi:hypothetical protein